MNGSIIKNRKVKLLLLIGCASVRLNMIHFFSLCSNPVSATEIILHSTVLCESITYCLTVSIKIVCRAPPMTASLSFIYPFKLLNYIFFMFYLNKSLPRIQTTAHKLGEN